MTHVTCRLTAKNRNQLRNPTLVIEYGLRLPFFLIRTRCKTKRSPPGDPHRRLSIAVNWSVNGVVRLRPSNQVICIFLCAPAECSSCTHRPVNRTLLLRLHFSPHAEISRTARELKSSVWIGGGVDLARKIGCHGNVP